MLAMATDLGLEVDLGAMDHQGVTRNDALLYSESSGRFIVTINPADRQNFEAALDGLSATCIGDVTAAPTLIVRDRNGNSLIDLPVTALKQAWQRPFGNRI
jgi:phosphoribosylformylglycinamidine synthase